MKSQKEKSLEGALRYYTYYNYYSVKSNNYELSFLFITINLFFSVELFEKTCDEARDWMTEKMDKLDGAEVGLDLKTIQALQRRHLNLERELAPVEEKVNRVNLLANSVKVSYPNEKGMCSTNCTIF